MNRPGQPPQRPPNLGPTQGIGGPFRPPYQSYGLPPRSALQQGFPGMPSNHRTPGQNMVLPSPNFIQSRAQGSFSFGGTLHQVPQQAQAQHQQSSLQHSHQQQPQSSTTSSSLPPHLALTGASAPSIANAQSSSTDSDGALDPNDFPALGSAAAGNGVSTGSGAGLGSANATSSPVTTLASSYASQAGTGVPAGSSSGAGGSSGAGSAPQLRDFTADDFPALSGQGQSQNHSQSQGQGQGQSQSDSAHPPGLNGFAVGGEHHAVQRQNVLAGQTQSTIQVPGVLNLASQRTLPNHAPTKLSLQTQSQSQSNHVGLWNASSTNPTSLPAAQSGYSSTQQNGASSQNHLQQALGAPPGVHPSSSFQQSHTANHQNLAYSANSILTGDAQLPGSATQTTQSLVAPQTPAQQILMSAADRWGLLGLLALMKSADADQSLLSIGTDLGTMGLDMQHQGNLFSTFITPWSDSSAAHTVEPDYHLPTCYNVHPPPPGPTKAQAFSEETLFFMFYAHPRDALQEVAAQELNNRQWRFNRELRLWLTKDPGQTRVLKTIEDGRGEIGMFTYWDPDNWEKSRKEFTVMYADLEDKLTPVFAGPTLTPNTASAQAQVQQQAQTTQTQLQAQAAAQAQARGNFPVGIAAAAI